MAVPVQASGQSGPFDELDFFSRIDIFNRTKFVEVPMFFDLHNASLLSLPGKGAKLTGIAFVNREPGAHESLQFPYGRSCHPILSKLQ